MLEKFQVKNFKNFRETLVVDFSKTGGYQFSTDCLYNGIISKMLIYGRNATGKTNLGKAIMDIQKIFYPFRRFFSDELLTNADSAAPEAEFSYFFNFDGEKVIFSYKRDSGSAVTEEELVVNDYKAYHISYRDGDFTFIDPQLFSENEIYRERYLELLHTDEDEDEEERFIPFIRWLMNNTLTENDPIFRRFRLFCHTMNFFSVNQVRLNTGISPRRWNSVFLKSLVEQNRVGELEMFLNTMGVECRLIVEELPDGEYELYFYHDTLVPFFRNASSGTLALFDLYRKYFSTLKRTSSLLIMDEFDAFFHYEMAENLITFLKERFPQTQVIMTTHNTNLMTNRLFRPDCLFILSRRGSFTALCDATPRELREGHNLEKMYISGEFSDFE